MKKLWRMSWQQRGLSEHESLWIKIMKIALLVTFVAGIFAANLMGNETISNAGVLNDYFIEKFRYAQVNGENLFFYIVGRRLPLLFLLFVLLFTSLGMAGGMAVLGWQGFSIGFMLSAGIAKYGVKGILLVLGGLFPQYLFYIPVYGFCFCTAVFVRRRFYRENEGGLPERKLMYGMVLLVIGALLAVFLTGIFLESYVNPMILRQILKIF